MTERPAITPPSALHAAAWWLTFHLTEREALSLTSALARVAYTRLMAPDQPLVFDVLAEANKLPALKSANPRKATKRGKR